MRSHAPRGRRRLSHTRAIFKPSRADKPTAKAEPLAEPREYSQEYSCFKPSRKPSCSLAAAEPIEYSAEYSRLNPSEPPAVQNWFVDRFTPFLTHFQQSQTGSLLFRPFRIDLQCPFCQIQLPEGDIVIARAKSLQKMHIHSSQS